MASLVSASLFLLPGPAVAQVADLVLELAPGETDTTTSSAPTDFYRLGQRVIFTSRFPGVDPDLWVTEGTPATTRLLAEFNSGVVGQTGEFVYFVSDHTDPLVEPNNLWRTNGTPEGTQPILAEGISLEPEYKPGVALGDVLVFSSVDSLWRTDGTAVGTETLAQYLLFQDIQAYGSHRAVVASESTLWITDGTTAGTRVLHEASFGLRAVAVSGGRIFLSADEEIGDTVRTVLWVFDSPESPSREISLPASFSVSGTKLRPAEPGALLFAAEDRSTFKENLWYTNGTAAGTRQLSDLPEGHPVQDFWYRQGAPWLYSGFGSSGSAFWRLGNGPADQVEVFPACGPVGCDGSLSGVQPFADHFYLRGSRGPGTPASWISSGTSDDLRSLKSLCEPLCAGADRNPLVAEEELFFFGANSRGQYRLYLTDGTRAGTRLVAPLSIEARPPLSGAAPMLSGEGAFGDGPSENWLLGLDALGRGREPWLYTGDSETIRLLADAARSPAGITAQDLTASGDGFSFLAASFDRPSSPLRDVYRLSGEGPPVKLTNGGLGSELRLESAAGTTFLAESQTFNVNRLWGLGETPADSAVLATLGGLPSPLVSWQGKAFFTVEEGTDLGLWETDGTADGTKRVFDPAGQGFEIFSRVVSGEDGLYYLTIGVDGRFDLWRSDGTEEGTGLLGNLGVAGISLIHVGKPATFNGATYFLVCRFESQTLWRLPEAGGLLEEVGNAGFCSGGDQLNPLFILGGRLVFHSGTISRNTVLWALEPNLDQVIPLANTSRSGFLPQGVQLGDRLVFTFGNPATGVELWVTDGTEVGTGLLRNIFPSYNSSAPRDLVEASGLVYFAARDLAHGEELWVTDGTEAGTRLVHDIFPGAQSSSPEELTVVGDRLYFTADDGLTGRELWVLPLEGGPACRASEEALCLQNDRFRVEARWRNFRDEEGTGQAVDLTQDTGYFWFFNEQNVETVLKVLDGRANNDHFWSFYGALSNVEYWLTVTDTETGLTRRYYNPLRNFASVGDTFSFGPQGASLRSSPDLLEASSSPLPEVILSQAAPGTAGACAPSSERLCVNGGRFAVEVDWQRPDGETGAGKAVDLTDDTGYFWFFRDTNVELILKVLDGTANNGNYWVFYGSLSNVDFDVTVTDTLTGEVRTYLNRGREFASVGDTEAFTVP